MTGDGRPEVVGKSVAAGAIALGAGGMFVGFIIGLQAYAPTAWAAAIEIGAPSAVLGALLGLVVGMARR